VNVPHRPRKTGYDVIQPGTMNDDAERLSRLRHDLSNPLSALLAETQLLLLNEAQIDPETLTGLREIEALAIRMRSMLREL
jgi:signal transduction histidine kinase